MTGFTELMLFYCLDLAILASDLFCTLVSYSSVSVHYFVMQLAFQDVDTAYRGDLPAARISFDYPCSFSELFAHNRTRSWP